MLVVNRKVNEAIVVGDRIRIVVVAVTGKQVKLGIEAPPEFAVRRSEKVPQIARDKPAAR